MHDYRAKSHYLDMAFAVFPQLLLKELRKKTLDIPPAQRIRLDRVKEIFDAYPNLILSNRQVFYQFVRRGWCDNVYNRYLEINTTIRIGRYAGELDWDRTEDRSRSTDINAHWNSPEDVLRACAESYAEDKWATQAVRVEVAVEKDALVGIIGDVCRKLDVPCGSARGFDSLSQKYQTAQRIAGYGQPTVILYLGDHDPSGLEMNQSLAFTLGELAPDAEIKIERIALTWDQCLELPEYSRVPVKVGSIDPGTGKKILGDPRTNKYISEYGEFGWELDSLEPDDLTTLVETAVAEHRDDELWAAAVEQEEQGRQQLQRLAEVGGFGQTLNFCTLFR